MFKKLKKAIESKRNSKNPFWKALIHLKDSAWRTSPYLGNGWFTCNRYEGFNIKNFKRKKLTPNLIILGAMKSGTSSIFHNLKKHKDIFGLNNKESGLFLDPEKRINHPNWTTKNSEIRFNLSDKDLLKIMLRGYNGERYIFDGSTYYTKYPTQGKESPKKIKKLSQNPKLLYIVRNPISRIISHYLHLKKYLKKLKNLNINTALKKYPKSFINFSLYYTQISQYLKHFPKKDIKIIIFEEFIKNEKKTYKKILKFLGLDSKDFIKNLKPKIYNKSENRKSFKKEELKLTKNNYKKITKPIKEDIRKLEALLGRKINWDLSEKTWVKK